MSPLGMAMCQNRLAVPTWSYAMEKVPPKQIVELGSLNGGFTTVMGVHAWRIGCSIFSYDLCVCPNYDWKSLSDFLGIVFIQGDLFSMVERIKSQIQMPGTTYLWCDNGNKIKEFNLFAPMLKPGDVIAAHDYCCDKEGQWWPWQEIKKSDVENAVISNNLVPFFQDHFDTCGWLAYRKI